MEFKTTTMTNLVDKSGIKNTIDKTPPEQLISYMEQAFTDYSSGKAVVPPVGTLSFKQPPGDVHIKYGYIEDEAHYVIKIASGFYDNPNLGLSSSNGLNLVFSQKNGLLETILMDEGYLTDVRTAVAGAVAAKYLALKTIDAIGIVGTGIQARLQLKYLKSVTSCRKAIVWGRSAEKGKAYASEMEEEGFEVEVAGNTSELTTRCNLIVTTTPSTAPLIDLKNENRDMLITAMGADTEGKQELSYNTLQTAALLALDSRAQCEKHGEIHKAFNEKLLMKIPSREIGDIISDKNFKRPSGLIVADLTGIATQDMLISKLVLDQMKS